MIPKDRKALAGVITLLLALAASGSASAFTITTLSGLDTQSYQLRTNDLNTSWWSDEDDEETGQHPFASSLFGMWSRWRTSSYPTSVTPVPEPSAALVFGLG